MTVQPTPKLDEWFGERPMRESVLGNVSEKEFERDDAIAADTKTLTRLARQIGEMWNILYDSCGPVVRGDMRGAARQVLRELGGDVDAFEHYIALALADTEWLTWTRKCNSAYGVAKRLASWIAKRRAAESDNGAAYDWTRAPSPEAEARDEARRNRYLSYLE